MNKVVALVCMVLCFSFLVGCGPDGGSGEQDYGEMKTQAVGKFSKEMTEKKRILADKKDNIAAKKSELEREIVREKINQEHSVGENYGDGSTSLGEPDQNTTGGDVDGFQEGTIQPMLGIGDTHGSCCEGGDDCDSDGIANGADADVDGDGLPNGIDFDDINGNGIPNSLDPDMDCDGDANGADADMDGDGVLNSEDIDADADGIDDQEGSSSGENGENIDCFSGNDHDCDGIDNVNDPDYFLGTNAGTGGGYSGGSVGGNSGHPSAGGSDVFSCVCIRRGGTGVCGTGIGGGGFPSSSGSDCSERMFMDCDCSQGGNANGGMSDGGMTAGGWDGDPTGYGGVTSGGAGDNDMGDSAGTVGGGGMGDRMRGGDNESTGSMRLGREEHSSGTPRMEGEKKQGQPRMDSQKFGAYSNNSGSFKLHKSPFATQSVSLQSVCEYGNCSEYSAGHSICQGDEMHLCVPYGENHCWEPVLKCDVGCIEHAVSGLYGQEGSVAFCETFVP